ncbi:MAG: peptide chain release factor N(5)-glutamine methyltransferase [Spirochaetes bacterium]|nr:peptide chain release factor N(5)-glutamine methyltransferase [Spirochaetota bacterium]
MTVKQALAILTSSFEKSGSPTAHLDAEVLLAHALEWDRYMLFARDEKKLTDEELARICEYKERRKNKEPIAYIIGKKEFYSLEFYVDHRVLIPRPETELIVDLAISYAPKSSMVLDVGTGSGIISVTLKYYRPDCDVYASDISFAALQVAKANAARILGKDAIYFFQGDLLSPCRGKKFDVILSNPPYIGYRNIGLLPKELSFEPGIALYCGDNGKEILYRIISNARYHLREGGILILEIGEGMKEDIGTYAKTYGYYVNFFNDYAGIPRAVLLRG